MSAQQDAFDAEMMPTGPAPMSGMAVAGFVSSVIFCCPVLSPLLGLIFSLVGLMQTKGGMRRGRGLAIAGVIIALLVGVPLQGYGGYWSFNFFGDEVTLMQNLMSMDSQNVDARAAAIYELGSPNFKSKVGEAKLAGWLADKFEELGGVQSITISQQQQGAAASLEGRFKLEFKVQFPEKTVPLLVDISLDMGTGHWLIEDVIIDEDSVLGASGGAGDEASAPTMQPPKP